MIRRRIPAAALIWLCAAAGAIAQQVQCSGVVNAASYEAGLPEAGALASVFCTGIPGVSGLVVAPTQFPLPTRLAGVSVLVNTYYFAPILAVANLGNFFQVNFQVPHERSFPQKATLQVSTFQSSGTTLNSQLIENLDFPKTGGLFAGDQGLAIAKHISDGSLVTPQNPVAPGEMVAILGTGFGPTYPPKPVGFPAPANPSFAGANDFWDPTQQYNVDLTLRRLVVGTTVAKVNFIGLAPNFPGVDQVVFQVPPAASSGLADVILAVGYNSCVPEGPPNQCSYVATGTSNTVKLPIR